MEEVNLFILKNTLLWDPLEHLSRKYVRHALRQVAKLSPNQFE